MFDIRNTERAPLQSEWGSGVELDWFQDEWIKPFCGVSVSLFFVNPLGQHTNRGMRVENGEGDPRLKLPLNPENQAGRKERMPTFFKEIGVQVGRSFS